MAKKRIPFFSILGEKQTYLNLVYILFAFPLSVFYFSLSITGFSLSLGLLIIVVGFFIFIGTMIMIQGFRWLDVQLTRVFLGLTIVIKKEEPQEPGFTNFLNRLFGAGATWKSFIFYLLIKFPMDTIIWSVTIAFIAVTLELLLAPVFYDSFVYNDDFADFLVRFFGDVYVLPFLGIIWGMISLHVIRGLAWVCRGINQVFLSE
ncbi:MAG: hypothetical protein AMS23_02630 [Bacteroides sp. SM1_62]|nr:MAG: hypothetical protein AMS26_00140 [Bacteroides sp. SM23_62]KPL26192.1 MAG: hypothetical protein AMS23_02630 [Bacteroides sp. SM1_62]